MNRVYNFSAGPSCLPEEVLNEAAAEMLNYNGTGQSVMEMSHRSSAYLPIIENAEKTLAKYNADATEIIVEYNILLKELN